MTKTLSVLFVLLVVLAYAYPFQTYLVQDATVYDQTYGGWHYLAAGTEINVTGNYYGRYAEITWTDGQPPIYAYRGFVHVTTIFWP